MPRLIDLTGQHINGFSVRSRAFSESKSGTLWLCLCDYCGSEHTINSYHLRNGSNQPCSCRPRRRRPQQRTHPETYIGKKFGDGKLTILEFDLRHKDTQKRWYVKYRCDCGNERWTHWSNIKSGKTTSCGCSIKEHLKNVRQCISNEHSERNKKIVETIIANPEITYQEVAESFGVSHQRVQAIVKSYGAPARGLGSYNRTRKQLRLENELLRAIIVKHGIDLPDLEPA